MSQQYLFDPSADEDPEVGGAGAVQYRHGQGDGGTDSSRHDSYELAPDDVPFRNAVPLHPSTPDAYVK